MPFRIFFQMLILRIKLFFYYKLLLHRIDKDIEEAIKIYNSGKFSIVLSVKKVKSNALKQGYIRNQDLSQLIINIF